MQNTKKHLDGLPQHNGNHMVSLLFMVICKNVTIKDTYIELSRSSIVVAFSDRPHRIAKPIPGGAAAFLNFYLQSDFKDNPPNVTFSANFDDDQQEYYTIFEMGKPILESDRVLFPIIKIIGDENPIPNGTYSNASMVIDSVWDTIGTVLEIAGGAVTTVAAGVGTVAACTVGEVATLGAATAICVSGVVGTIAAGTATAGVITKTAAGS